MATLAMALIGEAVPPRERGRFQTWIVASFTTASCLGPITGGYVTEHFGWRAVFCPLISCIAPGGAAGAAHPGPARGPQCRLPLRPAGRAAVCRLRRPGAAGAVPGAEAVARRPAGGGRAGAAGGAGPAAAAAPGTPGTRPAAAAAPAGRAHHPAQQPDDRLRPWRADRPAQLPADLSAERPRRLGRAGRGAAAAAVARRGDRRADRRPADDPDRHWHALRHLWPGAVGRCPGGGGAAGRGRCRIGAWRRCSAWSRSASGDPDPVVQITVQVAGGPARLGAAAASVQFSRTLGAAVATAVLGALLFGTLAAGDGHGRRAVRPAGADRAGAAGDPAAGGPGRPARRAGQGLPHRLLRRGGDGRGRKLAGRWVPLQRIA